MPGKPAITSKPASLVLAMPILVSAAWYRFKDADHLLFGSDQMITLMAGIRLHLLSWWNLGAPIRDNFFKSALMSIHGLGDSALFYPAVGVFRLLHIPVTEANLFSAGATFSVLSLVLLWRLVSRFFGPGPALVTLALAAWNPPLITTATLGYQMNCVVLLQIATLYAYMLHVTKNRWWCSVLTSGLVILCAGSELFYIGPVLLALHWACRRGAAREETVGWWAPKNFLVWGGYAGMLLVNLVIFLQLPPGLDLTLFGHLALKPAIQQTWSPAYTLQTFADGIESLMPSRLRQGALVLGISLVVISCSRLRSRPFVLFAVGLCAFMAGLTYMMHFTHLYNLMHLLVPMLIIVGLAIHQSLLPLFSRWRATAKRSELLAGLAGVLVALSVFGPWAGTLRRVEHVPPAYTSMKAVGYAVRELGDPNMHVMILSDHAFMPASMEYYLGLSATFGEGHPTEIYTMQDDTEPYYPSRLAERTGVGQFDYYVDFVQESFPGKLAALADLASLKLHEVAQVSGRDGSLHARVYSPREAPLKRVTIDEGNAGFDRTYAQWENLFYDAYVGTIWYFGVNY